MDRYILFDYRGCMLHSYFAGTDPDGLLDPEQNNKVINSAGWGVRNFLEMYLMPALEQAPTNHIIVCLEGGNERRQQLFSAYKAKRRGQNSTLVAEQIDLLEQKLTRLLLYLGLPTCRVNKAEADDLIAYLVGKLPGAIDVYTPDKDLVQLVSEDVFVFLKRQQADRVHPDVPTHLTSLFKCLVGDSSDGYGGVTGFGPAAWTNMVKEYGIDGMEQVGQAIEDDNIAVLQRSLDAHPDKQLDKIVGQWLHVQTMYRVAMLHPEWCEFRFQTQRCYPQWDARVPSKQNVLEILTEFGLNSFSEDLKDYLPQSHLFTADMKDAESRIDRLVAAIEKSSLVTFDLETWAPIHQPFIEAADENYVDILSSKITGASFTFGEHSQHTVYICFDHADTANFGKPVLTRILQAVQPETTFVAHNASFEMAVVDLDLGHRIAKLYDTMIMSSYVDENRRAGLKALTLEVLRYKQTSYKEVVPDGMNMKDLSGIQVFEYGADDAICTAALFKLFKLIMTVEGTWDFYERYEVDTVNFIVDAYKAGIEIDWDELADRHAEDLELIETADAQLRSLLASHCSELNEEGYRTLLTEKTEYLRSVYRDKAVEKRWTPDELKSQTDARIEQEKERLQLSCRYRPWLEVPAGHPPHPTFGTVKQVCEALGLPVLKKFTKTEIGLWASEIGFSYSAEARDFKNKMSAWGSLSKFQDQQTSDEYLAVEELVTKYVPQKKKWIGTELNLGSPVQKTDLLYGMMNLPIRNRTRPQPGSLRDRLNMEGAPSTNENAMDTAIVFDLKPEDWKVEALKLIKETQAASTRIGLYYIPYPLYKHPKDGRLHPGIRNCGTVTRRPTGSQPNPLQIAKGGTLRNLFLPLAEDHVIVSIDFAQQELQILAAESQDPELLSCYVGDNKKDLHSLTASGFLQMDYEEFIKVLSDSTHPKFKEYKTIRGNGKGITFGISYGAVAATIARNSAIPFEQAKKDYDSWLTTYAEVPKWQEKCMQQAMRTGYVKTAFGNLRHVTDSVLSSEEWQKQRAGRQAANSVIQGTAADCLKVVLTESHRQGLFTSTGAIPMIPLYDELVCSCPKGTVYKYITHLLEIMKITPPGYPLNLYGDASLGRTWGEQIELGTQPTEEEINKVLEGL